MSHYLVLLTVICIFLINGINDSSLVLFHSTESGKIGYILNFFKEHTMPYKLIITNYIGKVYSSIFNNIKAIEGTLKNITNSNAFLMEPRPICVTSDKLINFPSESSLENPFQHSILWGVPKARRSKEQRRNRRIGMVNYFCKLIPLRPLRTCLACGNVHETKVLCPTCYSRVKDVTEKIKTEMINSYGKDPIEHEYVASFEGENLKNQDGFVNSKRVIEIPDQRPPWFSSKLTQKTNVTVSSERLPSLPNATNIEIK